MTPQELLRKNIEKYVKFTDDEFEILSRSFEQKKVNKKESLLQFGEVCRFEGFVTQGLFKVYTIGYDGKEHILYFGDSDWWIGDIKSYIHQTPASLFI